MIRRILLSSVALVLATLGLATVSATTSGAAATVITAGAGSHVTCNITASVKLTPSLKNDWVQSAHASDPVAAVAAIADTQFAAAGPVVIKVKGSGTCTGTVTDGVHTAAVTAVKFSLANDPAHLGSTSEATCLGLVTGIPPSTAEYDTTIDYTATGAKVTPTTVTDQVIPPASFDITGGTVSGSFAGGTSTAAGVPDATTVGAVTQGAPTSSAPVPAFPQCQPTLVVKTKHGVQVATLKAPKGLKKVGIVAGSTLTLAS